MGDYANGFAKTFFFFPVILPMPQKKKPSPPPLPSSQATDSATAMNNLDFDSLEDKIRGNEILQDAETRSSREAREVKKKLEAVEVDRRMEELRRKIGAKK